MIYGNQRSYTLVQDHCDKVAFLRESRSGDAVISQHLLEILDWHGQQFLPALASYIYLPLRFHVCAEQRSEAMLLLLLRAVLPTIDCLLDSSFEGRIHGMPVPSDLEIVIHNKGVWNALMRYKRKCTMRKAINACLVFLSTKRSTPTP